MDCLRINLNKGSKFVIMVYNLYYERINKRMNIQIFGVKKCFDTQKAERYFKERRIKYQLVDLSQKGLSKGELQSVKAAVGLKALIDEKSKEYTKLNLSNIRTDSVKEELLLNNPKLYKTPIIRNGKQATVGYVPEIWENWED
jgi:arsenate reductase